MEEPREYLVPDYYPDFACKMGECRSACCVGWPISLSMQDYFHLLGVNCSKWLRGRLDCAMRVLEKPTQEEYARINPRYDGDCPLRLEDGRCAIHAELGEEALAYVCRLYPRGPRTEGSCECSCANSCEAVLELLMHRREPLRFIPMQIAFDLPKLPGRTVFFETVGREQEIRLYFIGKLQERSRTLPERMLSLGKALRAMEEALSARDERRVDALLQSTGPDDVPPLTTPEDERLAFGLRVAEGMLEIIDERSDSVRSYGEFALKYFREEGDSLERYHSARRHFEESLPDWQNWFENMLVNHMFFSRFPFQDRPESMLDEFIAICAVYALLRFLCIGWMHDKAKTEEAVDVAAAAFRLIDHTSFDRFAAWLLKNLKCDTQDRLRELISL